MNGIAENCRSSLELLHLVPEGKPTGTVPPPGGPRRFHPTKSQVRENVDRTGCLEPRDVWVGDALEMA